MNRMISMTVDTNCARPTASPALRGGCVKRLSVLGATGSIGTSTLDLIGRDPDAFEVVALTAARSAAKLAELAIRHRARFAAVCDEAAFPELSERLAGTGIRAGAGPAAMIEAASLPADCVVAAIVGAAGLAPTFAAARQGCRVALANKECLVSAGSVFLAEIARCGSELVPVDSEHSAAFQVLAGADAGSIEKITLTASGGPFRTWSPARIAAATAEQALCHPNWSMGAKITIDSATLMNKGLELIEAYHLFPVEARQLDAVVHPQSIIHCLVQYKDGSLLAQLAAPDMRTPIAVALAWPARMEAPVERLDLAKVGTLTFEPPDEARFPCLTLAKGALQRGGSAPAVLNAANEVAVAAFLAGRIPFGGIANLVEKTLAAAEPRELFLTPVSLDDVLSVDREARRLAERLLQA